MRTWNRRAEISPSDLENTALDYVHSTVPKTEKHSLSKIEKLNLLK